MKILKPPWVTHNNGKAIFSIDVHPDGSRFATAGQGESCGRITIWNVLPLLSAANEKNPSLPKMLCQMDNHLACVNCVRWSHNGTLLASAGDDKLIMIWRYAGGTSKVFGSTQDNVETWRCIHTLRGHSGDVLDLAWAPQDNYLASCSVDNSIIVWNSLRFPEQVKVLRGHTSLVKGVTWDPIGKYLASQSSDKTLIVWRTSDWLQEKCVSEPFEDANGTTHVLRLDWSPDGTYLVSAHAMNNMGPTAQVLSRDGFTSGIDFVGHRKAVTCVKFNPQLLKRNKKISKKNQHEWIKYCCCAVGSRDSSCSIWLTSLRRPLVVIHDVFNNSVMDLSWNKRGTQLFVCSSDGTMALIEFTQEEIGMALSEQEKSNVLCNRYGKSTITNGTAHRQIIEDAELLNLHQNSVASAQSSGIANHMSPPAATSCRTKQPLANGYHTGEDNSKNNCTPSKNAPVTPSKQIETRTKDGRRRITPIFLSPPPAVGKLAPPVFTSTNEISKIVIEHASSNEALPFAKPQANNGSHSPMDVGKAEEACSDVMATIKPMSSAEAKASTPTKAKLHSADSPKTPKSKQSQPTTTKISNDATKENISRIAVKRKLPPPQASKKKQDASAAVQSEPTAVAVSVAPQPSTIVKPVSPHLPVASLKKAFSYQMSEDGCSLSLNISNNIVSNSRLSVSSLQCTFEQVTWSAVLSNPVISVQASRYVLCLACKEHTLSLFSTNGQRLLPDVTLDSDVSFLSVNRHHCMVVTSQYQLFLWDLECMRCIVRALDVSHFTRSQTFEPVVTIHQSFLTENNIPCVVLSNQNSYIYHTSLQTWMSFRNADDSIHRLSNQDIVNSTRQASSGPVSRVSNKLRRPSTSLAGAYKADSQVNDACTLSYIQDQLALCIAMNSSTEYRTWLMAYIRYLTKHDKEPLLRELCAQCAQTVYKSKRRQLPTNSITSKEATSKVDTGDCTLKPLMGLDRKELLKDILPIIGTNLKLQRLYTEYSDLLDIMQSGLG